MQKYLYTEFLCPLIIFFLLLPSSSAYFFNNSYFSFDKKPINKENLTYIRDEFNQSNEILPDMDDSDYITFNINMDESSLNNHYVKEPVENNTGRWKKVLKTLNLEALDMVNSNDSNMKEIPLNNFFTESLVIKNGSSIYTEPFKNENNSATNYSLSFSVSEENDVKNLSMINDSMGCHKNNFSESLFCKRETKRRISCYLNFSETADDALHYVEPEHRSITSRKDIPQYFIKNASCNILITGDSSYYAMHNHDNESAISEIHLLFKHVNHILSNTDFNENGRQDDVSVNIQEIILKRAVNNSDDYNSTNDITKIIDDFREMPQNSCASLLFVAIPTDPDYVSTAYIGGICKNNRNEPDPARNVAVINLVDSYGCRRSLFTAAWIVAMAIGHVMGSADKDCDPMLPVLLEKYQDSFFSDCGRRNIYNLLTKQGSCLEVPENERGPKSSLKPTNISLEILKSPCGNGRINPGEECDCGTKEQCRRMQSCCIPPGKKGECHYDRLKGYECDWSEDCCTRNCKIVPKTWHLFCGSGDDSCAPEGSYCDGKSSHCPVPKLSVNLLNGEMCGPGRLKQLGAATCQYGRCNSTVCQDAGLEDCMCASSTKQQCRICCRQVGSKQKGTKEENARICIPAEFFGLKPKKEKFFYRHPGTLCNEVRLGHCNRHGKCVQLSMAQSSAVSQVLCQHFYHIYIGVSYLLLFHLCSLFLFSLILN